MTIDSVDTVFYTLAFLVPGFISHSTLGMVVARRNDSVELSILRFLTLSAFNYAIWSWLVYLLTTQQWFADHPYTSAATWAFIILLAPVGLGLFLGFSFQKEWRHRLLQKLTLRPVHVVPVAWDWHFGRLLPSWVLITLKDGRAIPGLFASNSFASSDPGERDIYVEQLYSIGEGGTWNKEDQSKGIWINCSEIAIIEFWPVTDGGVRE